MSLPAAVIEEFRSIRPYHKFEGHTRSVYGVVHLPGEQRMMTCSHDGSLRVWNLQTGKQTGNDWRDGESGVNTIALSLDGKKVISGSGDAVVRLWDVDMGKVIAKWTGHNSGVVHICWNRDGRWVVSGDDEGTARVWDVESGKTVLVIETGLTQVWAVIYSPDTTMIATGGHKREEEYLKIWDANTGELVANLKGDTGTVYCLAWTADGKTLISGSEDHSIRTWNTTTWQQIAVLTGHTDEVYGIAISLNGRILASTSRDSTARLWNLETGQPIGSPLQHTGAVECPSFSRDGKQLATGCSDSNAYTWDISTIVEAAGLSELLNPNGKSLLDVCDAFINAIHPV
ncbi:WD40 repeat-like protein [Rhizopogon salebrosus TDB-379]|nr:WD40 repeat-like protein [Rhizopogon salebrosus TDB-379]